MKFTSIYSLTYCSKTNPSKGKKFISQPECGNPFNVCSFARLEEVEKCYGFGLINLNSNYYKDMNSNFDNLTAKIMKVPKVLMPQ